VEDGVIKSKEGHVEICKVQFYVNVGKVFAFASSGDIIETSCDAMAGPAEL
jgi:hypothetical protein